MDNQKEKRSVLDRAFDEITRFFPIVLAFVSLGAAIWRMAKAEENTLNRFDSTTLLFLGVAGALLLIREVKTFGVGDLKVEFERVQKMAEEAKSQAVDAGQQAATAQSTAESAGSQAAVAQSRAENAVAVAIGTGKVDRSSTVKKSLAAAAVTRGEVSDDPRKGQFGSKSESNNRILKAEVKKAVGSSDIYTIELSVSSTNPDKHPLEGVVRFYLHDTFANDKPVISVGPNGCAELKLRAWGAFTVGAVADDGDTLLELDLAELESAPERFRQR